MLTLGAKKSQTITSTSRRRPASSMARRINGDRYFQMA
jgi:hypothetical protein